MNVLVCARLVAFPCMFLFSWWIANRMRSFSFVSFFFGNHDYLLSTVVNLKFKNTIWQWWQSKLFISKCWSWILTALNSRHVHLVPMIVKLKHKLWCNGIFFSHYLIKNDISSIEKICSKVFLKLIFKMSLLPRGLQC